MTTFVFSVLFSTLSSPSFYLFQSCLISVLLCFCSSLLPYHSLVHLYFFLLHLCFFYHLFLLSFFFLPQPSLYLSFLSSFSPFPHFFCSFLFSCPHLHLFSTSPNFSSIPLSFFTSSLIQLNCHPSSFLSLFPCPSPPTPSYVFTPFHSSLFSIFLPVLPPSFILCTGFGLAKPSPLQSLFLALYFSFSLICSSFTFSKG